jgi:hypothetical protein
LHLLNDDDPDKRIDFCEWALAMSQADQDWTRRIIFGDECTILLNGEVNRQTFRYWSEDNLRRFSASKTEGSPKLNVWCGIVGDRILGPYYFDGTITTAAYVKMLEEKILDDAQVAAMAQGIPLEELWWQ